MNQEESITELGTIRIHKNVIASIAAAASKEVEGVKRIGADFKSTFFELLGKNSTSSIKVEFTKANEVKLEIPLIIKYGYSIPNVSGQVQENVHNAIEKMTNLTIKDININIQSIERG
ncbi:MAG: Asp23/Gls24 family envelope stress response protein [Candidatus Omnitrophota bacterium]